MQPKRHPLDGFIYHPALCHLAPGATIPAFLEAAARRDRCEEQEASRGQDSKRDESVTRASHRTMLHLPLTPAHILTAYAAFVRKAVTVVTFGWRNRTRRRRLDPTLGALRTTGLFVRPHALHWREDVADGGDSQLMPATLIITDPSHRQ
jgi:hypothetical protein